MILYAQKTGKQFFLLYFLMSVNVCDPGNNLLNMNVCLQERISRNKEQTRANWILY